MNHRCTDAQKSSCAPQKLWRRGGFTLLELLVVVTIMIFITTLATMNYFGAVRTGGYTTVSHNVFNTLLMARQRACIDNKAVYVYLLDTTNFVLQEAFGTIALIENDSFAGGYKFYDPYVEADAFSANRILIDIDHPGAGAIIWQAETLSQSTPNVDITGFTNTVSIPSCALHVTNDPSSTLPFTAWQVGDHYGNTIYSPQMLPKGFVFNAPAPPCVFAVFNPDGTVVCPQSSTLVVQEVLISNNTHQISFTVDSNGRVSSQ